MHVVFISHKKLYMFFFWKFLSDIKISTAKYFWSLKKKDGNIFTSQNEFVQVVFCVLEIDNFYRYLRRVIFFKVAWFLFLIK